MRHIICEDCKKSYDYDKEEFCPRCGAFNQPVKTWGTDSQGNVVRVDGINERDHARSFVHHEVHREKAIRKVTGLDQSGRKPPQPRPQPPRQPQRTQATPRRDVGSKLKTFFILLAIILLFNLIIPILIALL